MSLQHFRDGLHPRQRPAAQPSPFTSSDFAFDVGKQVYLCSQRKELTCHARMEDCAASSEKARCLSKSTTSRRYLSVQMDTQPSNLIDETKAKVDTDQGKRINANRLGIVKPAFANICVQKRMRRFTFSRSR
jgi:hypothetical protein